MSADLGSTIEPKSDQLNADSLQTGPITITVTKVALTGEEQPVEIHFEGDNGKPYRPGKSMRRLLVRCWGSDGAAYVGRSMTLFRDEKVLFGGVQVGGIRISHLSHIDQPITMALTASKTSRKPYTVQPLPREKPAENWPVLAPDGKLHEVAPARWLRAVELALAKLESREAVRGWWRDMGPHIAAIEQQDEKGARAALDLLEARLAQLEPEAEPSAREPGEEG